MNTYLVEILTTFMIMTTSLPSGILGKHIDEIVYKKELYKDFSEELYSYRIKEDLFFLGKSYNRLSVMTDKNYLIKYYKMSFAEFDRDFYELMVNKYGEPNFIGKTGAKIYEPIANGNETGLTAYKFKAEIVPCTFDENPSLICWYNPKISIEFNNAKGNFYKRINITFGDSRLNMQNKQPY